MAVRAFRTNVDCELGNPLFRRRQAIRILGMRQCRNRAGARRVCGHVRKTGASITGRRFRTAGLDAGKGSHRSVRYALLEPTALWLPAMLLPAVCTFCPCELALARITAPWASTSPN